MRTNYNLLLIRKKQKNPLKYPVKNVTGIFSCPFDDSLVENGTKSDENPIIFLANAMDIP